MTVTSAQSIPVAVPASWLKTGKPVAWSLDEIETLFDLPFADLIFRAQTLHREHHDPNRVQLSTLLSIKTGGCSEDCGYCPQAARYHTGVENEPLMDVASVVSAAKLAKENNIPPKILVVHRFTQGMVTNARLIKPVPEVQVVMDMDGWGAQSLKINSYRSYIHNEPVEFTGFKLFYKNDFRQAKSRMLTPAEVLKLKPAPVYIQYQ